MKALLGLLADNILTLMALTGLVMLSASVAFKFGPEVAGMLAGTLLLVVAVFSASRGRA